MTRLFPGVEHDVDLGVRGTGLEGRAASDPQPAFPSVDHQGPGLSRGRRFISRHWSSQVSWS
jgi:hypothetical protein